MRYEQLLELWTKNGIVPHKNKCVICGKVEMCNHQEICVYHFNPSYSAW